MTCAASLFDELLSVRAYRPSKKLTVIEQFFQRLSRRSLLAALGLLSVALLMAVLKAHWQTLPAWFATLTAVVLLLDVLAWYGMILSDAIAAFIQVLSRRVRNHHDRASFDHDTGLADRISSYPESDVAQVDAWYEERARSMDRRISTVFGRELAIVGLVAAMFSGKAQEASSIIVNFFAPLFRTTPKHVIEVMMVAVGLLVIGAFGAKSQVGRCGYIRYLIHISTFRRSRQDSSTARVVRRLGILP